MLGDSCVSICCCDGICQGSCRHCSLPNWSYTQWLEHILGMSSFGHFIASVWILIAVNQNTIPFDSNMHLVQSFLITALVQSFTDFGAYIHVQFNRCTADLSLDAHSFWINLLNGMISLFHLATTIWGIYILTQPKLDNNTHSSDILNTSMNQLNSLQQGTSIFSIIHSIGNTGLLIQRYLCNTFTASGIQSTRKSRV